MGRTKILMFENLKIMWEKGYIQIFITKSRGEMDITTTIATIITAATSTISPPLDQFLCSHHCHMHQYYHYHWHKHNINHNHHCHSKATISQQPQPLTWLTSMMSPLLSTFSPPSPLVYHPHKVQWNWICPSKEWISIKGIVILFISYSNFIKIFHQENTI